MEARHRIWAVLWATVVLALSTMASFHHTCSHDAGDRGASSMQPDHSCIACQLGAAERNTVPACVAPVTSYTASDIVLPVAVAPAVAPAFPVALRAPPAFSC